MAEPVPRGPVRIARLGEAALLVVLGDHVDAAVNDRVHRLASLLAARGTYIAGLGAPVPAHASVLLPFDPLVLEPAAGTSLNEPISRPGTHGASRRPSWSRVPGSDSCRSEAVLRVIAAGPLPPIQDAGRPGLGRLGVPLSGACDT
jgi:hypothetical protein